MIYIILQTDIGTGLKIEESYYAQVQYILILMSIHRERVHTLMIHMYLLGKSNN